VLLLGVGAPRAGTTCCATAELMLQALGAVFGVATRLASPPRAMSGVLSAVPPVTLGRPRNGVPGAMISVSLVQAALVAALELTPGRSAGSTCSSAAVPRVTLSFSVRCATNATRLCRQMRQQDAALQRSMRFAVAGQLASALTHELNQPMTALLSYVRSAELMTEPLARRRRATRRTLRKAGEEAGRAAAVLRRLREFYRGEVHDSSDRRGGGVRAMAEALQDRIRRSDGGVRATQAEGVPTVMVDRTQLEMSCTICSRIP